MRTQIYPLVSCLMPTRNRRQWVPMAIQCFKAQDYPNRELVVVDDGPEPVADLVQRSGDARIRYIRIHGHNSVGAKLNVAVRMASGPILARWDDDDYHAFWRLTYQVANLMTEGDADLCGVDRVQMLDVATGQLYRYEHCPGGGMSPDYVVGGTMVFRRTAWEREPFKDLFIGEDGAFLAGRTIMNLPDERFYVATNHSGNTCRRILSGENYHPWGGTLDELMPAEYREFYGNLQQAAVAQN